MAERLSGAGERWEAEDYKQFTLTTTPTRASTVAFNLFDPLGAEIPVNSITAANSGIAVAESGFNTGLFHISFVLPSTEGFYTKQWIAYDAASRTGMIRDEFEIVRTEATSFFSYGNKYDILRTARQIFSRADITQREIKDYMEPSDNLIDARLATITGVPISPVPPVLRDGNKVITLWHYYCDRFGTNREDPPPGLEKRYNEFMLFLTEVQSGNQVLITGSGTIMAESDLFSTTATYKPIFDSRDWESMHVDADRVQADRDADDGSEDA